MRLAKSAGARPKYFPLRNPRAAANNPPDPKTMKIKTPSSGSISTLFAVNVRTISQIPRAPTTTDSIVNRVASSARALAALAGSCFMEERLTYRDGETSLFSHDGIHDSQTHLAAPTYFYELLNGEIACSERTGTRFSLIRVIFRKTSTDGDTKEYRVNAADILYFSEALKDVTRKQDCVARIGINECIILMRSKRSNAESLLIRLISTPHLTVENSLVILAATVEYRVGENALTLLNRLDKVVLSTL